MKTPLRLAALLVAVAIGTMLFACSNRGASADSEGEGSATPDSTAQAEDDQEDVVPVQVATLGTGPMEAIIKSSANLEAERSVEVFSEASRRVVELLVEEGDRVAKGQLLCRLQDDEQRNALGKAQAMLDKLERERNHQQTLHERGLTTDKALNDAISDYEQQRLAVEDAQRELGYASVRAPIAGTVTQRLVKVGDQVTVRQHLFDLIDFDSLVARVYVPEKNLPQLRAGMKARVTANALRVEPFDATVDRVSPIVDARSGTVKVTVAVGGQEGLRPGLFVDVDLITATNPTALRISKRALIYDNDQVFLYRLKDEQTVERVLVVPRLSDRDFVEPAHGFEAGQQVVIAGQAGLKDGSRIEVVEAGVSQAPGASR